MIAGAEALGGVLDHRQPMACGDGLDGVHVGALAIERDRHDGAGASGDGGFDLGRIDVVGDRIDVDEHRTRAKERDHLAGGDEGEGGGDDLVATTDLERHHGREQGIRAARQADAVTHADELGQTLFQFLDLRPLDEQTMVEHGFDAGLHIAVDTGVLGLQVDELHAGRLGESLAVSF